MYMSREVDQVLAVWRELERVRQSLPDGSTERTFVVREILEIKRLYRSLTHRVIETHGVHENSGPILAGAYDALRRAKIGLEASGADTVRRETSS
jgi:hypothetical protein